MRVLPATETWTGLQAGHPAESHPSGGRLPALGLSYCPARLGRAGSSVLADSLVSQGNSLEPAVVTRGNAPPESAGLQSPRVWLSVPLGPSTDASSSQRMSLRHHGFRAGAAGQRPFVPRKAWF